MSAKIEPRLTVVDLDVMPDDGSRYELFEGEIFVSRAPGLSHQRVLVSLLTRIGAYLEQHPLGEVLPTPGVVFDDLNSAIPDIVFISRQQASNIGSGERILEAPDLVIEIVSPGAENARRDREVKRQIYGKFGVKESWIADPESRTIEIYRLMKHALNHVNTLRGTDEITSPVLPNFNCKVSQIFDRRS